MIGAGEHLGVAGRVAVGPDLSVLEPLRRKPLAQTSLLLRAAAVLAYETPREPALRVALEHGAHDAVDLEQAAERNEVRVERGGGEDDRVAQLAVAAQTGSRVAAEAPVGHLPREPLAETIERVLRRDPRATSTRAP